MLINEHYEILSTKHGLMINNRHDMGIGRTLREHEEWATNELALTSEYARGVVLDIGANIGTHTLVYARTADRVYAFEPQPFMFDMLCTNLLLNNVLNVTPIQCALGPINGITHMDLHDPTQQNSPAGERVGKGESEVSMHTLDALGIGKVDFIKIDVEGFELEVLKGMSRTLELYHPDIYIEIHYVSLIELINKYLWHFGYAPTALVKTVVIFPDDGEYDTSIPEVYGYLYTCEEVQVCQEPS